MQGLTAFLVLRVYCRKSIKTLSPVGTVSVKRTFVGPRMYSRPGSHHGKSGSGRNAGARCLRARCSRQDQALSARIPVVTHAAENNAPTGSSRLFATFCPRYLQTLPILS